MSKQDFVNNVEQAYRNVYGDKVAFTRGKAGIHIDINRSDDIIEYKFIKYPNEV